MQMTTQSHVTRKTQGDFLLCHDAALYSKVIVLTVREVIIQQHLTALQPHTPH